MYGYLSIYLSIYIYNYLYVDVYVEDVYKNYLFAQKSRSAADKEANSLNFGFNHMAPFPPFFCAIPLGDVELLLPISTLRSLISFSLFSTI